MVSVMVQMAMMKKKMERDSCKRYIKLENVKKCNLLLYALFWRTRLRLRRQLDFLPVTLHYTPLITCFNKEAKKNHKLILHTWRRMHMQGTY